MKKSQTNSKNRLQKESKYSIMIMLMDADININR